MKPVKVKRITKLNIIDSTYDIEMSKNHNFFANSILTHNSHSEAYSLLAWIGQYYKQNYPIDFYCWMLQTLGQVSWSMKDGDKDKVKNLLMDYKSKGYELLYPDINRSKETFTIDVKDWKELIRVWFNYIYWIGDKQAKEIEKKQPYTSYQDFINRVDRRIINKKVLQICKDMWFFNTVGGAPNIDEKLVPEITYIKRIPAILQNLNIFIIELLENTLLNKEFPEFTKLTLNKNNELVLYEEPLIIDTPNSLPKKELDELTEFTEEDDNDENTEKTEFEPIFIPKSLYNLYNIAWYTDLNKVPTLNYSEFDYKAVKKILGKITLTFKSLIKRIEDKKFGYTEITDEHKNLLIHYNQELIKDIENIESFIKTLESPKKNLEVISNFNISIKPTSNLLNKDKEDIFISPPYQTSISSFLDYQTILIWPKKFADPNYLLLREAYIRFLETYKSLYIDNYETLNKWFKINKSILNLETNDEVIEDSKKYENLSLEQFLHNDSYNLIKDENKLFKLIKNNKSLIDLFITYNSLYKTIIWIEKTFYQILKVLNINSSNVQITPSLSYLLKTCNILIYKNLDDYLPLIKRLKEYRWIKDMDFKEDRRWVTTIWAIVDKVILEPNENLRKSRVKMSLLVWSEKRYLFINWSTYEANKELIDNLKEEDVIVVKWSLTSWFTQFAVNKLILADELYDKVKKNTLGVKELEFVIPLTKYK